MSAQEEQRKWQKNNRLLPKLKAQGLTRLYVLLECDNGVFLFVCFFVVVVHLREQVFQFSLLNDVASFWSGEPTQNDYGLHLCVWNTGPDTAGGGSVILCQPQITCLCKLLLDDYSCLMCNVCLIAMFCLLHGKILWFEADFYGLKLTVKDVLCRWEKCTHFTE